MGPGANGYVMRMVDPRLADHAMGIELQLEELTEQRLRATVQGREADARQLENEIRDLHTELAATVEQMEAWQTPRGPGAVLERST
jgi:hypothetical protein